MENIQVIKTNGAFQKNLENGEKAVCYQSLDCSVDKFDLSLAENSKLELLTFNNGNIASVDLKANLKKGAHLVIYNMVISGKNVSINEQITLEDETAKAEVLNVCLGYNEAKIDSLIHIYHNFKATESDLETYAIALDNAVLTLDNNATIKNGCHKSIAHQKAKGLNLSANSTIKAQPNLYIDEYDVEASHSASVGNINKDELFYLMSRGLPEAEARKIVVLGFINPLVDKISSSYDNEIEEIKQGILKEFSEKLK
ncbi:MAG: SufD family Fe-S cluster assembly protein [Bacilli bacterium]|nr:SufD family Fe-S cluster assembly protein [Bacilli bacterium]